MSEHVAFPLGDPAREVSFCSYCAARPEAGAAIEESRVCAVCSLGLLLRAAGAAAPGPDDAFLVVDELLAVRAVSRRAEELLEVSETTTVDRHVSDLVEAAGSGNGDPAGPGLTTALLAAVHGTSANEMALRPRRIYGVRWWARIAPCAPRPAALIVLSIV